MKTFWEKELAGIDFNSNICAICQRDGVTQHDRQEYYEEFKVWVEWTEYWCSECHRAIHSIKTISGFDPNKLKRLKKLVGELEFVFRKQELARLFFGSTDEQLEVLYRILHTYREIEGKNEYRPVDCKIKESMPINAVLEWMVESLGMIAIELTEEF